MIKLPSVEAFCLYHFTKIRLETIIFILVDLSISHVCERSFTFLSI